MSPEPAEDPGKPRFAISADRIFDGVRWHNDAVVVIDRGVVQCIAPRGHGAGDWPIEFMPPGTVLAPGFIDLQVNGGAGILLNDEPTPDAMRAIARAHDGEVSLDQSLEAGSGARFTVRFRVS